MPVSPPSEERRNTTPYCFCPPCPLPLAQRADHRRDLITGEPSPSSDASLQTPVVLFSATADAPAAAANSIRSSENASSPHKVLPGVLKPGDIIVARDEFTTDNDIMHHNGRTNSSSKRLSLSLPHTPALLLLSAAHFVSLPTPPDAAEDRQRISGYCPRRRALRRRGALPPCNIPSFSLPAATALPPLRLALHM